MFAAKRRLTALEEAAARSQEEVERIAAERRQMTRNAARCLNLPVEDFTVSLIDAFSLRDVPKS